MSKYLCVGIARKIMVEVMDEKMAKRIEEEFYEKVEKDLFESPFIFSQRAVRILCP